VNNKVFFGSFKNVTHFAPGAKLAALRRGHTMQHCAQLLRHEVARNVADDGHTVNQLRALLQK